MNCKFKIILMIVIILISPIMVSSHSGGTDSNGCHAGSQPYHCHNSKSSSNDDGDNTVIWIFLIIFAIVVVILTIKVGKCKECNKWIFLYDGQCCKSKTIPTIKPNIKELLIKTSMICGACSEVNPSNSIWCIECGTRVMNPA